jgi:uncharacterized membrane protein
MVLELKAPHSAELAELKPLLPVFLSYVLSFIYVGIYWNNHHHMLQATKTVSGPILWANLHLLFWLSVIPFASSWMGETHLDTAPVALYGAVLLTAVAYTILAALLVSHEGPQSDLARALGSDVKGKASLLFYVGGIIAAFFVPLVSIVLYVAVALIWLIPDRRIERQLKMT